jgi:hypothetical protein
LVRGLVGRKLRSSEIELVLYRTSSFKNLAASSRRKAAAAGKLDHRQPGYHLFQGARSIVELVQDGNNSSVEATGKKDGDISVAGSRAARQQAAQRVDKKVWWARGHAHYALALA